MPEVTSAAAGADDAAGAPSVEELSSTALSRLLQMVSCSSCVPALITRSNVARTLSRIDCAQGFDEDRARPAIEEALKPRTRKGKTLPIKMDLEQLVGR